MKQRIILLLSFLTVMLGMSQVAKAEFADFAVELRDASGGILTTDEASSSQTISFGLAVSGGTVSRVAADDASAVAIITGKTGNNHGLQNFSATIPVNGSVKITMSTCSWGGNVTVKNSANETVASFTTSKGSGGSGCYVGGGFNSENIISQNYVGEATTLTISGGVYVGFFAVEAINASAAEVSYSLGDVTCAGTIVPTGGTYAVGDSYTIPAKNFTLYKEGYTLTGWTDGTTTYANGQVVTLTGDLALTPVFTQNTVSLADRTEDVTLTFDFQRNNGAPTLNYGGNTTGVYVAQASVNGTTIDVKLDFDTKSNGKIANANWGDWCQLNNGTTFTVPSCNGATVSVEAFNTLGTGEGKTYLTIDGKSDYTPGKTISYEISSTSETIDVVIGNEGSYYRYIQVVLPVIQQGGGEITGNGTKVHMLGDSTMAPYDENATITRGWGMYFGNFLTNGWTSTNYALGGRDARSGYNELWTQKAKGNVEAGDYVLIQFAHNDEMFKGVDHDDLYNYYINNGETTAANSMDSRGTNPSTTYKALLGNIIDEVKAKGAIPVLVGPACRFYFDGNGKIKRNGKHDLGDSFDKIENGVYTQNNSLPADDHTMDYNYQMQQVATAKNVAYIDLTTASAELYEGFGPTVCASDLQSTKTENGVVKTDGTHFRTMGALLVARECARLMKDAGVLADNISVPTGLSVSPSSADMGNVWINQAAIKEFTINGFDLTPATGSITVTAPAGIELSTDKETWSTEGLSLNYSGGTIVKNIYTRTTIYTAGEYNASITVTDGTTNIQVPLTATGVIYGGGETASATWALTTDGTVATVGDMTITTGPTFSSLSSRYNNNQLQCSVNNGSWPKGEDDDPSRYIEFSVKAPAGKSLDINNISMNIGGTGTHDICCHIYYSTDDFNTRTTIYAPTMMTANVMNEVQASPVIQLAQNQTLKVRIYPWSNTEYASGKYIAVSNVVISGQSKDDNTPAIPATVSYSLEGVECQGTILPESTESTVGENYTIPAKNYTLYKEGYSLTGWTDGTTTYPLGTTITLQGSMTLKPVFTQNTVGLGDRTAATTLKWNFRRDQGAPSVAWRNTNGNVLVTQATIGTKTIDVPMIVNTNPGKFNNANNNDWAQTNIGTKFIIPSAKGAKVSMEGYAAFSTTTIDGLTDYTSGTIITDYEVTSKTETIEIVVGELNGNSDCGYMRYIQVELPELAQAQERAVIDTDFQDWTASNTTSAITTNHSNESITFTYSNASVDPNATNEDKFPTSTDAAYKGYILAAKSEATVTTSAFSNITKVRYRHGATGSDRGWGLKVKGEGDEDWVVVNDVKIGGTPTWVEVNINRQNVQLQWYNLNTSQNAYMFEMEVYSNVIITAEQVTLATSVSPAGAGTVSYKPSGTEFDKDTEITLTASKNFGYRFKQWTKDNEVLGTDAILTYTLSENSTITAEFEAVNTYELNLTVDGTNNYMVQPSPAPQIIDNKWMYEEGATVVLTASQYDNLVTFTNWSDNTTNSTLNVTMDDNKDITAYYSEADIIAGWDFYKAGNNGRVADFADEDNTSAALNLMKTADGTTSSWLDMSTERNNGYESFKGAAIVWATGAENGDVGNYHWQTKVNAEAFTDINVQFQMLYNYNAYPKYNAEYSLDGESWTNFGSITMTGAKAVASFNETLPVAANNQKNLYIRMIADKENSTVAGSASKNDGNTLAMFFITGTPKLVEDPVAPSLVSSVPANNATGASAMGKIVLTFDKKVQLTSNEVEGDLNGAKLTPAVSGKTVTFSYKGLDYDTPYTFTLPANSIQNLTGATLTEAVTISFTTMVRPAVAKGAYDAVVSTATELKAAIDEANNRSDKSTRYRIFLKKGEYKLPTGALKHYTHTNSNTSAVMWEGDLPDPITYISAANISFIGEDRDATIITQDITNDDDMLFSGQWGTAHKYERIGESDVLQLQSSATGIYFQDVTVKSGINDALGRNLAVHDKSSNTIYKNVNLWGYQDTWTSNNSNGLYYFEGGVIRGRTDYLCGSGDAYFNNVVLRQIKSGYAAVPSNKKNIGWVFKDCTFNGDTDDVNGTYTLGRPWGQGTCTAVFIDTKMNIQPQAIGWSEMSGGWPERFAEYNSMTENGNAINLEERKTVFAETHANNPVLTADEAATYSDMSAMFGEWQPTLLTELAPVPTGLAANGSVLTWTGSDYALLYAVVKDGNVIDFTTEATYTTTAPGTYSIRAANEMGGLSEASETVTVTVATLSPAKEYTTYCSSSALDFSNTDGLKAYVVTAVDKINVTATLKEIAKVPAGTGIILHKTANEDSFTAYVTTEAESPAINKLVGVTEPTTIGNETGYTHYILSNGLFYEAEESTLAAGKAYLRLSADEAPDLTKAARGLTFVFDESTDIRSIYNGHSSDNRYYNLNGQRVAKPGKGLYIVNGRKMIIQ